METSSSSLIIIEMMEESRRRGGRQTDKRPAGRTDGRAGSLARPVV